jgi:hypothetical protein
MPAVFTPSKNIKIRKSKIHGEGIFAKSKIYMGQVIDDNHLKYHRGFNHSCNPNVLFVFNKKKFIIAAIKDIKRGEELTVMYPKEARPNPCCCFNCCKP